MTDHAGILAGQGAAAKHAFAGRDAIRRRGGGRRFTASGRGLPGWDGQRAAAIRPALMGAGRGGGRPVRATGRTLARPLSRLRIVGVA